MAVHKLLVDDFEDANYSLLAIHCDIEDYRLAYFLNQNLATRLVRTKEDLDFTRFKIYPKYPRLIVWMFYN